MEITIFEKKDYDNFVCRIQSPKMYHSLNVQRVVINSFIEYMKFHSIVQVMPLLLTTESDPLNHDVFDALIKYYNNDLHHMKSMILHKQIILSNVK